MELPDGADLLASAPLAYRQVCSQLRDIASSLALLHDHRLVHRDISPNNVRLTRDGRATLIDIGALTAFGPSNETAGRLGGLLQPVGHAHGPGFPSRPRCTAAFIDRDVGSGPQEAHLVARASSSAGYLLDSEC
jgi:serine/threonine protein kinase